MPEPPRVFTLSCHTCDWSTWREARTSDPDTAEVTEITNALRRELLAHVRTAHPENWRR